VAELLLWIGPAIAVGSFALSVWNTVQIRRRDAQQQAEQVTAWLVHYDGEQDHPHRVYVGLRVRNASSQLVYDVIAQTILLQGGGRKTAVGDTDEHNRELGALIGTVPPGELTTRIGTWGGGMHRKLGIELAFQDAGGRYWLRRGNGKLKRVYKHPLDLYHIARPVGWQY
jgi:hypothetical protein